MCTCSSWTEGSDYVWSSSTLVHVHMSGTKSGGADLVPKSEIKCSCAKLLIAGS